MTLPVELLQRRRTVDRYDAVVVGAGLPGLVCGCALAGRGLRVVVIDRRKRPGGHAQTLAHQGYGVDLGPVLWESPVLEEVLAAVGLAEHGLAPVPPRGVQVAVVGERGIASGPHPPPLPGAVPSPSMLDAVRELLGVPPRVFAALGALYEELRAASAEQLEEWRRIEARTWLAERAPEPAVAAAFERTLVLFGAEEPAQASLAAVALHAHAGQSRSRWALPGDNPIPGARGVVQALVDRLIDAGGELRLGTRAVGMVIDARRFAALAVQREEQPFCEEVFADRCVLALSEPALAAVLPEEPCRALGLRERGAGGALLGAAFAVDADAVLGDEAAWAVRALPPAAAGAGAPALPQAATFVRVSAAAPRLAPPGRGLVLAFTPIGAAVARDARAVSSRLGHLRGTLQGLLGGDAAAIEWQRHWVLPWARGDAFHPATGPWTVPGFEAIYVANETVERAARAPAGGVVGAAAAALQVAERLLAGS